MKEITRIHLAKTPFEIEVEAKVALEKYVEGIEQAMKADEDTMREIEARMVELLSERGVQADGVIGKDDVESLKEQMGQSADFSEEPETVDLDEIDSEKSVKRLMRDKDNAFFGGVCSGIAAYAGINVFWTRLLAIILLFASFGTAIVIYIVLWVAMPAAKTTTEKLQMRGEPVTLAALKSHASSDKTVSRAGDVVLMIARVILGLGALAMAFVTLMALVFGAFLGTTTIGELNNFQAQGWLWALFGILVAGGLALLFVSSLGAWAAFRWKISRSMTIALILALAVGVVATVVITPVGMKADQEVSRDVNRLTKTATVELPKDLEGVKYVEGFGPASLEINDNRTESEARAEVKYLDLGNNKKPEVNVTRDGDTLKFEIDHDTEVCNGSTLNTMTAQCMFGRMPEIVVYGPFEMKDHEVDLEGESWYEEEPQFLEDRV